MGIIQQFNGASLRIPGAYSSQKVKQTGGLPLLESGVVGIVGEALKGPPGTISGILEFDSSTLTDLISIYGDGPVVDGARALVNASNDARIANGANRILVFKTNDSTQASLALDTGWGTLTSANYGTEENLINITIDEDTSETWTLEFGADWTTTPSSNLTLRVNGGGLVTLIAASCTSAAATVTEINSKLNTELGTIGINYASTVVNRISIDLAISGTGAKRDGMGISLEFVASAEYNDIGVTVAQQGIALVAGVSEVSLIASNPTRSFTVNRQSDGITETSASTIGEVGGAPFLTIGCNATTSCELTITSTNFNTVAVGTGASNLTLLLNNFATLNDLATFINAQTGYSCTIPTGINGGLPPTVLDRVSGVGIDASTSSIEPGQVKADAYSVTNFFDLNVSLVTAAQTSFLGLPDTLEQTFLAGGTRGSSSSSSFDAGFTAFEAETIDTIIPLISQSASDDIAEDASYTDSSSAYDIDSVHTQAREHCKKMSNTQNRSERNCYVGLRDTFEACKTEAKALNSEFVSLCIQDVQVVGTDGNLTFKQPHVLACLIAGIQAGGEVGEPATFKFIAANGIKHVKKQGATPSILQLFNSDKIGDKNQAIDAGITVIEAPSSGGVRIVLGNTTYQRDANFVFNRVSVLEAANFVAKTLRKHLEDTFIGEKARTGTAESIRNFTIAEMRVFLDADIIVGDDTNKGLGWKNLAVSVNGNVATLDITITPVQGIDFILARIVLDNIRQTA